MGLHPTSPARRRALLAGLAGLLSQRLAGAPRVHVVGVLGGGEITEPLAAPLAELGYVAGGNLRYEARPAPNVRALPAAASQLVTLQPEALLADGPAAVVLAGFTRTIPVVCAGIPDPVGAGLAESLRRPGRNVTGLTTADAETAAIAFGLLRSMRPRLRRVAVLHSPGVPVATQMRAHAEAAKAAGLEWIPAQVTGADDVERALAPLAGEAAWMAAIRVRGLGEEAVAIAARHRVATVGVHPGALMAYAREFSDAPRRRAALLDRVLKGGDPAEIAFELPDREVLVLNRATARAIGIEIAPGVLARATRVID